MTLGNQADKSGILDFRHRFPHQKGPNYENAADLYNVLN